MPHFNKKSVEAVVTALMTGGDGSETDLPRFEKHLLCDEDGLFPENFNAWEKDVLISELDRKGTVAWYRNPARTSQDSLGVTYEEGDEIKIIRPDFIFFSELPSGEIVADIVDPHGHHLADALPKLKGLAQYAEKNSDCFRRIEAIVEIGEKYRVLDLSERSVRDAIHSADNTKALYESSTAKDYR